MWFLILEAKDNLRWVDMPLKSINQLKYIATDDEYMEILNKFTLPMVLVCKYLW